MQTTASVVVGHCDDDSDNDDDDNDDDAEREGFEFVRGAGESEGAREEI